MMKKSRDTSAYHTVIDYKFKYVLIILFIEIQGWWCLMMVILHSQCHLKLAILDIEADVFCYYNYMRFKDQ